MTKTIMNRMEMTNRKIMSGIGQISLLKKWLALYCLPYREECITWNFDSRGYLESFEIILDRKTMLKDFEADSNRPEFINSGSIKVTVCLNTSKSIHPLSSQAK